MRGCRSTEATILELRGALANRMRCGVAVGGRRRERVRGALRVRQLLVPVADVDVAVRRAELRELLVQLGHLLVRGLAVYASTRVAVCARERVLVCVYARVCLFSMHRTAH